MPSCNYIKKCFVFQSKCKFLKYANEFQAIVQQLQPAFLVLLNKSTGLLKYSIRYFFEAILRRSAALKGMRFHSQITNVKSRKKTLNITGVL